MLKELTTSLIEATGQNADVLFCRNMTNIANNIIDKFPEQEHIDLHHRFASLCFYLRIANDSHKDLENQNQKIYANQGYNQFSFYECFLKYISSLDSIMDIMKDASTLIKLDSVENFDRDRSEYDFFNDTLNIIRNILMHEGIPFCNLKTEKNSFQGIGCADIAEQVEENVTCKLELHFINEKTKRPSTISRGVLQGVDFKSTIIYNRLPFLLLNILLHQLVCNISRANGQVSSRPEMPTPKLFLQVGKL
ncbi:MAG: hypothetical protein A3J94_12830 [Syntrophus sp. RIFOXYC2_FULL_54_9]|nr:MAG: hypothetical protein A3J94_12830 [Syntrophus sp. RIFOXYC2_FULL_54_9]